MNDKPLYINAETEKWFDRYVKTIAERDTALRDCASLSARVKELEDAKDHALFQVVELRGRLGQYEAQFAHDHNVWKATKMGQIEARCARYEAALRAAEIYIDANDACLGIEYSSEPQTLIDAATTARQDWQTARAALADAASAAEGEK